MAIFNLLASNIENLDLKLDGNLPVDRDELLALANSWGRINNFYTKDKNNIEVIIKNCQPNEKYNLSNLDVSQIKNFDKIFFYSYFNGDISNWNTSNAISMEKMFYGTKYFNSSLNLWNTSKVTSMEEMFTFTEEFNQDINSWNISQVNNISYIFSYTEAFNQPILWDLSKIGTCFGILFCSIKFQEKYNKGCILPTSSNDIKAWLIENKDRIIAIDIKHSKGKELDNFLLDISLENKSFLKKIFIKFKFLLKGKYNENI